MSIRAVPGQPVIARIVFVIATMDDILLSDFLSNAGLSHLTCKMEDEGVTLAILLQANECELALLATKIADRIKLRSAIEKLHIANASEQQTFQPLVRPVAVALPKRQNAVIFSLNEEEANYSSSSSQEFINIPATSRTTEVPREVKPQIRLPQDFSFTLGPEEYDFLENLDSEKQENLRYLLNSDTTGKQLLTKAENGEALGPRDRACIVKLIVEKELKSLDKITKTIRKDVWIKWASEVENLFKGENASLYYVPYSVVEGKVIQASGLIHNRLITHRRALSTDSRKRRGSSSSSESSDSGCQSNKSGSNSIKRNRPLPDSFKEKLSSDSDIEIDLDWLKGSSSPEETVFVKWGATFQQRNKLLASLSSYKEYFNTFPALQLPTGYQLLSSDFSAVYPAANDVFTEKYPLVKVKILKLLAEKGEAVRVDQQTTDLLELASVGEEQANVAAFLGIVTLLRQMPTVCIPRKKVWKLSREEVRSGFLALVATAADVERYCLDRVAMVTAKGVPNQPFILAVGPNWANISYYEIVIDKDFRYQLPNIIAAVKHTFHVYWALDCAYPKDTAPIWMFVQRAMFQITSKFDTEGVPLRELLHKVNCN